MKYQEPSPSKLKTTQSILANLYQKTINSAYDQINTSPTYGENEQTIFTQGGDRSRLTASLKREKQRIYSKMHFRESSNVTKPTMMTQPDENYHKHSQNCCIHENNILGQKLERAHHNEMLLQTYQEEVEYLKKMMFMQSEQIEKLRRMLRSQQKQPSPIKFQMKAEGVQVKKKGVQSRKNSFKPDRKIKRP